MSKKAKGIALVVLVGFVALVYWAVSTVPKPPEKIIDEPSRHMTYDNNTISEEKNGKRIWELKAGHMDVDMESQDATLTDIEGHFYEKDGRILTVTAKTGKYTAKTHDIDIEGDVVIESSDGARLTSDALHWTSSNEKLAAVGNATAAKDDMRATGDAIESTDGFGKIKIIGHAHLEKGVQGEATAQ